MLLPVYSIALWMITCFATQLQSMQFYKWFAIPSRPSGNCVYSSVNHTPWRRLSETWSSLQQTPTHTSSALSPWGVVSSPVFGEPRSKLFLPSRTFFCFLMLLSVFPLFSRRTGLVNHFFSVFVERLGPGELWMELRDGWGCKLATESDLPPLSLEETEYASGRKRCRWEIIPAPPLSPSAHQALGSPKHGNTNCLDKRFCDLWTLCKLYCTPKRGICPATGVFHNLRHSSHFLPQYLSLWKITDSKVI